MRADSENETVWLTQYEISFLFDRDKSVISRHIRNIFAESELEKDRVIAKNATTASDGKTYEVIFTSEELDKNTSVEKIDGRVNYRPESCIT